jgi:hypothetical protein
MQEQISWTFKNTNMPRHNRTETLPEGQSIVAAAYGKTWLLNCNAGSREKQLQGTIAQCLRAAVYGCLDGWKSPSHLQS